VPAVRSADRTRGARLPPLELTAPVSGDGWDDEWVEVEWVDAPDEDDDADGEGAGDPEAVPFEYDATVGPDDPRAADVLRRGEIEVLGAMPWSSNGTFLVRVTCGADHLPAIYKPERGERPLWDFPAGLWRREVAASVLSDHLGLGLVPTTVPRHDAPLGVGSLQAFVPARFAEHYFTIRDRDDLQPALRRLCAFDLVANSADRKGGHCLIDEHDRLWAIDNGLTFHREFKVRTVIWDYAGEPVPDDVLRALDDMLGAPLPPTLAELLEREERDALRDRAGAVLAGGRFPHDPTGRRIPWPLV
jgi:uncharacterized repeat protein (TIGR03843 family)